MVKIRPQDETEMARQFESTKNGAENCIDSQTLYNICKAYTNFLERVARKYNTTVNGVQSNSEAS